MGYFKEQVIGTMDEFGKLADGFVEQIAPTLAECFCDEDAEELVGIWNETRKAFDDEVFEDFGPPWTRQDAFYVHELFEELSTFVLISMENDW